MRGPEEIAPTASTEEDGEEEDDDDEDSGCHDRADAARRNGRNRFEVPPAVRGTVE